MGKCSVTFEAENQDELLEDIRQFAHLDDIAVPDQKPPKPPADEKKTRKPRKPKAKPADPPASPGEPSLDLDLGDGGEDLPMPKPEELNAAIRELMEVKGNDVAIQVMQEFGGSVKMIEIPEENRPLLWSEAKKALNG